MTKKPLDAIRLLLHPFIKLALHSGLTYREFTALCKTLYVKIAAEDFGLKGRPTNVSRIAVLTGLDRKEIKRIKDAMDTPLADQLPQTDRISRLLSGWHQDPQFVASDGTPRVLDVTDQNGFIALCRKYGGDVPSSALLKELIRTDVARMQDGTHIIATKRIYIPDPDEQAALQRAGSVMHDLGNTLSHNLFVKDRKNPARFERRATNINIAPDRIPAFRKLVETEGQAFLERIDDWLTKHENSQDTSPSQAVRLGLGLYWIEDRHTEEKPNE